MVTAKTKFESDAKEIRKLALIMAHNAKSSHSGGALSMTDILAVLYGGKLRITPQTVNDPNRDRFLLSKGHCCASLYAALAVNGFLDKGIALNGKVCKQNYDTYVLTGDGELDEGSCWEAIMFAAQQKLTHLCLIVDYNKIQSLGDVKNICDLAPLADKFKAFNWNVIEINGHNFDEIDKAFDTFKKGNDKPTVIIANTIKGKGVSYMEGKVLWHYRHPDDEQLKQALEELA